MDGKITFYSDESKESNSNKGQDLCHIFLPAIQSAHTETPSFIVKL